MRLMMTAITTTIITMPTPTTTGRKKGEVSTAETDERAVTKQKPYEKIQDRKEQHLVS